MQKKPKRKPPQGKAAETREKTGTTSIRAHAKYTKQCAPGTEQVLGGEFNFDATYRIAPLTATLWFWSYLIFLCFVVINAIVAIVVRGYTDVKAPCGILFRRREGHGPGTPRRSAVLRLITASAASVCCGCPQVRLGEISETLYGDTVCGGDTGVVVLFRAI